MTGGATRILKSTQHSMNRKNNPYLTPDTTSEDRWEDQANCQGKAYELFEYQESDSPLTEGMSAKVRMEFNHTNFELAAEICIECPVMFKCLESASKADRMWTVRGGEPPKRFASEKKEYERHAQRDANGHFTPAKQGAKRICHLGHVAEVGKRCRECRKVRGN